MTQNYNSAYSISLKPILMGEFLGQIQELYIWAYRKCSIAIAAQRNN